LSAFFISIDIIHILSYNFQFFPLYFANRIMKQILVHIGCFENNKFTCKFEQSIETYS